MNISAAAFADARPVLYAAWFFRLRERRAGFFTDYDKISYTPRLIVLHAGRARFMFPGAGDFAAAAGDVIYIPPSVTYHTQFFEERLETYNLNFDFFPGRENGNRFTESFVRAIPNSATADASLCEAAPAFSDAPEFSAPLYLTAPADALASVEAIYREAGESGQFSALRTSAMLTELLVRLLREARLSRSARASHTFSRIADYIAAHTGERLTGETLAAALNYHPYYMSRVVLQMTGEPLHSYILSVRLRQAKRMLCETSLPVAEIAQRLGFCDAGHFARVFARRVGVTPSQYRKNA